jgi:hypothetical protein
VVTAAWTREGRLRFKNGLGGDMTFDRAEFEGDVDVRHPQLALKSQQLALLFEEQVKPTTRAAATAASPLATNGMVAANGTNAPVAPRRRRRRGRAAR